MGGGVLEERGSPCLDGGWKNGEWEGMCMDNVLIGGKLVIYKDRAMQLILLKKYFDDYELCGQEKGHMGYLSK